MLVLWWILAVVSAYTGLRVVQVTDDNFVDVVLNSPHHVLVDFYADWCRHCKKLGPVIDDVATMFAEHDEVVVAKVNGDKDGKKWAKKYVKLGYPTVGYFAPHTREIVEFDGLRDAQLIANFVQLLLGIRLDSAAVPEVPAEVQEEAVEFTSEPFKMLDDALFAEFTKKPLVVFVSTSWCHNCDKFAPMWLQLIDIFGGDNIQFGKVVLDEVKAKKLEEEYDIQSIPTLLFVPEPGRGYKFRGKRELPKLVDAINQAFGVHRVVDGELEEGAGVVEQWSQWLSQGELGPLMEATAKETTREAAFYNQLANAKMMGDTFKSELERIDSLLRFNRDKLAKLVVDSLQVRRNILGLLKCPCMS